MRSMPHTHPSTPISQAEVCAFRLLKKSALTFLLLLRLDRPTGETEVASLLDIDRQTAHNHLDSLASIGLLTRSRRREGYVLTRAGRQLLMPEAEPDDPSAGDMEEFPPYPAIIINTVKHDIEDSLKTIIEPDPEEIPPEASEATWSALRRAGIARNPRTEKLARLPHITPELIAAHQLALQRNGKSGHTGLLISLLESGAHPPPLNENRHSEGCSCPDCVRLALLECSGCGQYPCVCR
jgi:biotin operon repressor